MKKKNYIQPKIETHILFIEEGIAIGSPQQQESIKVENWDEEEITKRFDIEGDF